MNFTQKQINKISKNAKFHIKKLSKSFQYEIMKEPKFKT